MVNNKRVTGVNTSTLIISDVQLSDQSSYSVNSRVDNPYWTEINIPRILGMESEVRHSNAPSSGVAVPMIIPGSERP